MLKSNFSAIAAARVQTLLGRAFRPQEVHAIVATAIREAIRYAESRCGEESPECQIGVYFMLQSGGVEIRYRRPQ